jgi:hypothetical protein
LSKRAVTYGPLACLRISPLLTWLVVAACRCCVDVQYHQMLSLAHVVFAFRSYQKCQILSANDDLEFPAPTCGALLPLAPIGARIQPLPFAPPSPFGRPALEQCLAQQAARGTLLCSRREVLFANGRFCNVLGPAPGASAVAKRPQGLLDVGALFARMAGASWTHQFFGKSVPKWKQICCTSCGTKLEARK